MEKMFVMSATTGTYSALEIGWSGIVKRISIVHSANWAIAQGQYDFWVAIGPVTYTSMPSTGQIKFLYREEKNVDAAPATNEWTSDFKSIDVNFYVDKLDIVTFYNTTGTTQRVFVTMDIVPVSDKSRLFYGGAYHNQ